MASTQGAESAAPDVLTAAVRDAGPDDLHFILHSWGASWADAACSAWSMQRDAFFKRFRKRFEALWQRGCEFKVACDPDDESLILGWMAAEPPVLHYVYVKRPFRRQGLAWSLAAGCGLATARVVPCSSWTKFAAEVALHRPALLRNVELL